MNYDVIGIGNAIVDILMVVSEEELAKQQLKKGVMTLIAEEKAIELSELLPQKIKSGGSVANTVAIMSQGGAKTAFIGKIAADHFGDRFEGDLRSENVTFFKGNDTSAKLTARSFILVTPDAERTMATYLGQAGALTPAAIEPAAIAQSQIVFLEGYLWDSGPTSETLKAAIRMAKEAGRKAAFTLSDPFCVERHRTDFLRLIEDDLDIVLANEEELKSIFQVAEFELALRRLMEITGQKPSLIVAVTRSEKGAVIVSGNQIVEVPTQPVQNIVDTTGAGDAFAAGFLQGLTRGDSLAVSAERGNQYAAQVIQVLGARPDQLHAYANVGRLNP